MNIQVNQVSRPARRIGRTSGGDDVFETTLKGGLVVVKMQEPGLQLTELSKSEAVGPDFWAHLIPDCVKLVQRFQDLER